MKKFIPIAVVASVLATGTLLAADGKAYYDKDYAKYHGADGKGAVA